MRRYVLIAVGFVLACGVFGVIASQVNSSIVHPRNRNFKIVVSDNHGGVVVQRDSAMKLGRIEVVEPRFDFGVLDPMTESEHAFVIRNTGNGPVELENLGTSCKKCTIANLAKSVLQPGEETEVVIRWNCGSGPHYSQSATIGTKNNIGAKSLQLRIDGRVRMNLSSVPEELVLDGVSPIKETVSEAVVFSQRFANAEVIECKVSRSDFEVKLEDVAADQLGDLKPTWAKKVQIKLPANLPAGPFAETVFVKVRATAANGEPEEQIYDLRVKGKVKRGVSILGPGIDERRIIEIGEIEQGTERKLKYKLKIQDANDFDLRLKEIICVPEFIKVTIVPTPGVETAKGLFDIEVTIPADAPVCNYMLDSNLGQFRIISGHPRVGEFPMALRFAVREP